MDQLEHYLDQVCRRIGGSRAMRQHVRQELREHLLDAVAQHKTAGLPEAAAVAKALEEFGEPEQVRSELEATHGQRMMAVVIDKALSWKEMTMRAKWLWTTWAYLGLVAVIALEVLFLTFMVMMIVPRFQKLLHDGLLDYQILEEQGATWLPDFLIGLKEMSGEFITFMVLGVAALWALFEWRVRSENKPFMRLAALGTAALALLIVVILAAGALVISFTLAMPAMGRMARPFALEQVAAVDMSVSALEQALSKKDWETAKGHADQVSSALHRLAHGPALTSITSRDQPPTVEDLRTQVKAAHDSLRTAQQAIAAKDNGRADAALTRFSESFALVREASKRLAR